MSDSIGPFQFDITESRIKGTTVTYTIEITATADANITVNSDRTHLFDDTGERRDAAALRGSPLVLASMPHILQSRDFKEGSSGKPQQVCDNAFKPIADLT